MLGDIRADVRTIRWLLEDDDGEEEETPKITPEEQARFDAFTEEINARIAERRARERAAESQDDKSR